MMRHLSAYLLICAVLPSAAVSVRTAGSCKLDGLSSSAISALHPRSIDDAPSRNSSF